MSNRPAAGNAAAANIQSLFDAAVAASRRGEPDITMALLDELLRLDPLHAGGHHLLGAEYAQAGKVEPALSELATSLSLDPSQTVARFQLGLLLLVGGRATDAIAVWEPLQSLGERHPLNLFRLGVLQLVNGQMGDAQQTLTSLLTEGALMPALQRDAQALLDAIGRASAQPAQNQPASPDAATAISQQVVLAAYERMQQLH